jgi:4'-phosphopantetheinyl transferase
MDRNPLYLWCAYPDDLLDEGAAQACAALLSEEERARVQRFKFERHRRESLATSALMRVALSHNRSINPQDWQIKLGEHGKPGIETKDRLQFNLSNSMALVVCLVAEGGEVGVDVEPFERSEQILKLAPDVFSPVEQAQLESLTDAQKLDRAISLWTLKESYIKARGMGLLLPLDKFSFLFDAQGIRLEIDPSLGDAPERWQFCQVDYAGHRIAVMADRAAGGELEMWEARPVVAPPLQRNIGKTQWFPHP